MIEANTPDFSSTHKICWSFARRRVPRLRNQLDWQQRRPRCKMWTKFCGFTVLPRSRWKLQNFGWLTSFQFGAREFTPSHTNNELKFSACFLPSVPFDWPWTGRFDPWLPGAGLQAFWLVFDESIMLARIYKDPWMLEKFRFWVAPLIDWSTRPVDHGDRSSPGNSHCDCTEQMHLHGEVEGHVVTGQPLLLGKSLTPSFLPMSARPGACHSSRLWGSSCLSWNNRVSHRRMINSEDQNKRKLADPFILVLAEVHERWKEQFFVRKEASELGGKIPQDLSITVSSNTPTLPNT